MVVLIRFFLSPTILLSVVTVMALACVPLEPTSSNISAPVSQKKLRLEDFVYEENIKTIRLYPIQNVYDEVIQPAVVPLLSPTGLILEFDQLYGDFQSYMVRLIHCNADWTKSRLNDMEFLSQYNEFPVTDYQYSFGTRTPYVHYEWPVPPVKRSGNYVLKVYRQGNEADLILTRRFMVVENQVSFEAAVNFSQGIVERDFNQQVDFAILYPSLDLINPLEEIQVVIRQNKRWDNALWGLKPAFVQEDRKRLEYRFFNLENNFQGGNEFRFFDLRSFSTPGQNIGTIDRKENRVDVFVLKDLPSRNQSYGLYQDLNGEYVVSNLASDPSTITSDYAYVHFFLETTPQRNQVFVFGALTDWQFNDASLMTYDRELGGYTATLLLKQGWYNYMYYLPDHEEPYYFEGSYYQTENLYEILVYYRGIGAIADRLIGYSPIFHNRR